MNRVINFFSFCLLVYLFTSEEGQAARIGDLVETDPWEQIKRFFSFSDRGLQLSLIGAVLFGAVCGLIGSFIVVRKMALFGDAVSHAVLPGVAIGFMWGMEKDPLAILIGATIFSLIFRGVGGDELINLIFSSLPGGSLTALIFVLIIIFLLGFILDFIEICYVIVPLIAPPLLMMGFDPVWLAILFAINLQTSFLTPPFGFSLFYLRGVADDSIKTSEIYNGVIPFILIQILVLILILIFPNLII